MAALLYFMACLTLSKSTVALNPPFGYDGTGPLNYLLPPNTLSSYPHVLDYNNNLGESSSQFQAQPETPDNCPNLEILQNILNLLKKLLDQDNDSQFVQPDRKLEVLTYLKKQLERSGPLNDGKVNKIDLIEPVQNIKKELSFNDTNSVPIFRINNDNPNGEIKTQFSFKYTIPGSAGCKEVLTALIQAVNMAHSQLINYCTQSGKCNVDEVASEPNVQLGQLPSILNDIISSSQPQSAQPQSTPTTLDALNIYDLQGSVHNVFNPPSQKELYNDYLNRLTQNEQGVIDKAYHNVEDNPQMWQNSPKHQQNTPVYYSPNLDSSNKFSYDALLKLYEDLQRKDTSLSVEDNRLNTLNYNLQKPTGNLYNAHGSQFKSNPNLIGNVEINPLLYQYPLLPQNAINYLLNPSLDFQENNLLSSTANRHNNLNFNSHQGQAFENKFQLNSITHLNPYEQHYLADYLNSDIHANKLLDSQRLESVSNPVKLVTAPGNNAIVELTYKLKQPQSLLNKPYYYVKYRMSYQAFISKFLELIRNPQLRSNPSRFYEELLSISNLAESPGLKRLENSDLTKLIVNNGGTLVSANVLSSNNPLDDQNIQTLQNLNAKLNTNDIVNLVSIENKNKGSTDAVLGLKNANFYNNADNLLFQNLDKEGKSRLIPRLTTSETLPMPNSRKTPMHPLIRIPKLPSNGVNPRVMYNTLLNAQSFSPFPFQTTAPPKVLLG